MKILYLLGSVLFVKGINLNVPVNIYKRNYDNNIVKVYEPKNLEKKELDCLVFYTGANSIIPAEIYSNFIKTLNNYNFSVNVVTNKNEITRELLYEIRDEYKNIVPITHSSGYVNAIQTIDREKNINKAIFLDPVDNSKLINNNFFSFSDSSKSIQIKNLDSILVLNAEKSYKGSFFPKPELPFIPLFGLDLKRFKKENPDINIEKIITDDYGHSDVLDILWSDLMHATLSKGNPNREQSQMDEYHEWLANEIFNFVNEIKKVYKEDNSKVID